MAVHKPWDRPFFAIGGSTMRNGFSLNLAEGQFGVFNVTKATPKGAVAVDEFKGFGNDTLFELRMGQKKVSTRTNPQKDFCSFPFKLRDVVGLRVSAPQRTEMAVDEVIIGYDGIRPETSIQLRPGEYKEINVSLTGAPFTFLGFPDGRLDVKVPLIAPAPKKIGSCKDDKSEEKVDMLPIMNEALKLLKEYRIDLDNKLTDFVDITPVIKLDGLEKDGSYVQVKYCMSVCDTGDKTALALVQQQYPECKVEVKERVGSMTTYEVTMKGSEEGEVPEKPEAYTQHISSLIKGCEDCPEGYSEVKGGFVYAVSLEDEGADQASTVESLANAVSGTAVKSKGQKQGQGMYVVLLSKKLSDEDKATFIEANPTATVQFAGKAASICKNGTVTEVEWAECGRCEFSTAKYCIVLPDDECGKSRLEELKAAYPDLVIEETGVAGGCQREYRTTVTTNVVCDECDDIYKDIFQSEAPESYDGKKWFIKDESEVDGKEGLYGLKFKGKVVKVASGECLRDKIGYVEDSVKIQLSGGYITDFNYSTSYGNVEDTPFEVTYLSKYKPRTHVYGNALSEEAEARTFFTGMLVNYDYMGRILTGNESNIVDLSAQYVDYAITLRRDIFSQGLAQRLDETITYHVKVPVGSHNDVEEVLNALAAANGVPSVKAFPNE